ncbi:MAG TPA: 3',5'-nucleoside bisphosphate phosphatase [Rhodocyclaceae bacterium]|nr:3',5'-nucleoside bisphosphate phosphatase [Rhodocyclaceae bacterium]
MFCADLHSHSTVSDGLLAPAALVGRAASRGVDLLALTDHDDIGGLAEARAAADALGMDFVDGVEISVSWRDSTVHVVGLGVDPGSEALREGLARIRDGRAGRARRMGEALAAIGIRGALEGASALAANPELVSRTHFARFLVGTGIVPGVREAFDRYLARGRPGYVSHRWAEPAEAVGWIRAAGGIAVLAHPGRYRLGERGLDQLLAEFKDCGGGAIEVSSGSHSDGEARTFARAARRFGLLASLGSDFHGPGESLTDLGCAAPLPDDLAPVWTRLC